MKKHNMFTQEVQQSWQEFSAIVGKLTPNFIKKFYRNKPLFYAIVVITICIELIVAYFIYTKIFAAA